MGNDSLAAAFDVSHARRFAALEGLRGFSAAIVFFVHFHSLFASTVEGSIAHRVSTFCAAIGHTGVDVFFVLSGFLIYGIVVEKKSAYLPFIWRRAVRLYPVFLCVLTLYLLIGALAPERSKLPGENVFVYIAANFLMLPGIFDIVPIVTVSWSLSYEMFFYLTLPGAVGLLQLKKWRPIARMALLLAAAAGYLCISAYQWGAHPRMIMFAGGMLVRELVRNGIVPRWAWGPYAALAAFAAVLTMHGLRGQQIFGKSGVLSVTPTPLLGLLCVSAASLVFFAFPPGGILGRLFSWDYLRWFGNMSYSYYLIHGFALHMIREAMKWAGLWVRLPALGYIALFMVSFAFTVAAGAVLFLGIEKPFSIGRRPEPRALAATVRTNT